MLYENELRAVLSEDSTYFSRAIDRFDRLMDDQPRALERFIYQALEFHLNKQRFKRQCDEFEAIGGQPGQCSSVARDIVYYGRIRG